MSGNNKRVAVIGAGISGVVTAAHLKNEGIDVTVFERSSASGGVWLYDERKPLEPAYPSETPLTVESTYRADNVQGTELERLAHAPPGPCYVGLKNNVATPLLETTLNEFPRGTEDFVSHSVLKDYIQDTATKHKVDAVTVYDTEVQNVAKVGDKWVVQTATLFVDEAGDQLRDVSTTDFDAVVVASGHYHAPRIPDIPGLAEWKRLFPERIQHSKSYRKPEDYQGKTFLLIGGSVSATDIARELSPHATTIYQSHRNGTFDLPSTLLPSNAIRIDEVTSFSLPSTPTPSGPLPATSPIPLSLTLKSGHQICNIDHVILCTGYHLTLPFLPQYNSSSTPASHASDKVLVTDGTMYHNLHKDIFYIPDPTLLFIGVPFFTATFSLFEFQAMAAAKVINGLAKLPSEPAMRVEYEQRIQKKGLGKGFHSLKDREEEYVGELLGWVNRDLVERGLERLEGHSAGWRRAKGEQVERLRKLFGGEKRVERGFEGGCLGGVEEGVLVSVEA